MSPFAAALSKLPYGYEFLRTLDVGGYVFWHPGKPRIAILADGKTEIWDDEPEDEIDQ